MGKFATGFIAGGIIGAIGLTYAFSDKRARRRVARDSKKVLHRANSMIDNITEKF